jgi:CelD/BcsL family acetyltransferase involved in cellulose biosynthesis
MAGLWNGYETSSTQAFAVLERGKCDGAGAVNLPAASTSLSAVFTLVRDRAAMNALEGEWNALFERSGKPHQVFQTFAWNWHWANAFLDEKTAVGPNSQLAILTGRRKGQLVTVWPMVLQCRGTLRELAWMGEPVSQYGDVLIDDSVVDRMQLLRVGWAHLCHELKPDLARLRKVRGDANIAPLLEKLGSLHTAVLEAPFVDLTKASDFAAYEERFQTRARRNRRRQMRRLEDAGAVVFKHLDGGSEASAFAATGIELKRRWMVERGQVSPALADVRMAKFMTAAAAGGQHSTATRVSVLLCDDKPAAIQIGFTCKKARALHIIVYDGAFEKMAAGVLNLEEAIRHGFNEGLERIDLLAPKAAYKLDWADGTVGVVDHAIGLSAKGKAYAHVYLGYLRQRLKAVVERMPQKLRQTLAANQLRAAANRFMALFGLA